MGRPKVGQAHWAARKGIRRRPVPYHRVALSISVYRWTNFDVLRFGPQGVPRGVSGIVGNVGKRSARIPSDVARCNVRRVHGREQ